MANDASRIDVTNTKRAEARRGSTTGSVENTGTGGDLQRAMPTSREGGQRGLSVRRPGALSRVYDVGDPFMLMRQMIDDMDQVFRGMTRTGMPSTLWSPQVEMFQRGEDLVVRADLPGLKKDDVDVSIENGSLVLQGERRNEFEDRSEGMYRSERSYGTFYRAIPLPDGVDADRVNASFQDGVLEVTVPVPEEERRNARKISIG